MDIKRLVIPPGVGQGSATELYLAAILAELQDVKAILQPPPVFVTPDPPEPSDTVSTQAQAEQKANEQPLEVELKEPAEQPKAKRAKK